MWVVGLVLALATPSIAADLSAKAIIDKALQQGTFSLKEGIAEIEMEITQASGRVRKNTMSLKIRKNTLF